MYESRFVKFDLTKKMCNNLITVSFVRGLLPRQSNYRRIIEYGVRASENVSGVRWCASECTSICVSTMSLPLCVSCSSRICVLRPLSLSFHGFVWLRLRGVKGTSWKKRQRGRGRMNERTNVRWTVQDWERQRREFANQSRGCSLAAHFYVININYNYTWRINASSKTWLRYVYNSHVPFRSMIIDNKSISILLHYFVLFFLFLNFCVILIYIYIKNI